MYPVGSNIIVKRAARRTDGLTERVTAFGVITYNDGSRCEWKIVAVLNSSDVLEGSQWTGGGFMIQFANLMQVSTMN